jgi:hypothetical protein
MVLGSKSWPKNRARPVSPSFPIVTTSSVAPLPIIASTEMTPVSGKYTC